MPIDFNLVNNPLCQTRSNAFDAAETLNTDLSKIHDWSMEWLVKFNPDKTESMIVSRKSNRPLHPPLMMDNKIINMVSEHKHFRL
jgi:hypothetical protein